MSGRFISYLENLKACLRFDPAVKKNVLREFRAHIEDRLDELKKQGLSEDAAADRVIRTLGSPRVVAQQLMDVYSQGSWKQAIFAALPHILTAWLLAIPVWQSAGWIAITCLVTTIVIGVGVVIFGWQQGKPTWLFPWLGYYMIPVVLAGALIVGLPPGWNWLVAVVYVPLASVALFYIVRQTLREDWALATLMMLPMPLVLVWALVIGIERDADTFGWRLSNSAPQISLSFLALAVTSATFVRVKQRRVKVAALVAPELAILILLGLTNSSAFSFFGWSLLAIGTMVFLLGPAWLEHRIK